MSSLEYSSGFLSSFIGNLKLFTQNWVQIVSWGWTASRREARLAEMSRPVVPRSSEKRLEELIRTFNLKKGSGNCNKWDNREDEIRRSSEHGRKRQISPAKTVSAPIPVPESKDEKEAALVERLEHLIKTFDLNEWVNEEGLLMDEPGERAKAWVRGPN